MPITTRHGAVLPRISVALSSRVVGLLLAMPLAAMAASDSADRYSVDALAKLSCEDAVARLNEGMAAKDGVALYTSGKLYDEGACVPRDTARAVQLWRSAVAVGNAQAAESLALKTGLGEGVEQDYAAAGALVKQAGVRLDVDGTASDYSLGYAFTWLRTAQRDFQYPSALRGTNVRGSADLRIDAKTGQWKLASYRRASNADDPPVGSNIDRSRSAMTAAVNEAAKVASEHIPKPDAARVDAAAVTGRINIGPSADDLAAVGNPLHGVDTLGNYMRKGSPGAGI